MSGRDGRYDSAFGRLGSGLLVLLAGGVIAFCVFQSGQITARREVASQAAQHPCKNPDDCAAQEAEASVRSANASEDSVDLALWQLGLNIAGLAGVAYTIFYARRAWFEAERSASAAHETLDETRRSERRQVRAYVRQVSATIREGDGGASVELEFDNCGQTPAHDLTSQMRVTVTRRPDLMDFALKPDSDLSRGPLFPGEPKTLVLDIPDWGPTDSAELKAGNYTVFMFGQIDYTDIFGERHYTRFRHYHDNTRRPGVFGTCPEGNEAT